jgi:HTH-type transcriptional regulator/antitoxin HigA
MITVKKDYVALTKRLPLVEIRNDKHLREANALLIELASKDMTKGESDYFHVLGKLTSEYERNMFPVEPITPIEAIEYLMEENELNQRQVAEILGCRQNRVSEILSGVRELSKGHITRLSTRFKVSANLFLPQKLKKTS